MYLSYFRHFLQNFYLKSGFFFFVSNGKNFSRKIRVSKGKAEHGKFQVLPVPWLFPLKNLPPTTLGNLEFFV